MVKTLGKSLESLHKDYFKGDHLYHVDERIFVEVTQDMSGGKLDEAKSKFIFRLIKKNQR